VYKRQDEKPKAARKPRDSSSQLQRELEQIERRIAAIAAERASLDEEIAGSVAAPKLAARSVRLARDAEALEARWMEVGTAIEAAEAQGANDI